MVQQPPSGCFVKPSHGGIPLTPRSPKKYILGILESHCQISQRKQEKKILPLCKSLCAYLEHNLRPQPQPLNITGWSASHENPIHFLTHLLTQLVTNSVTHSLNYQFAHSLTHLLIHLPSSFLPSLLIYSPIYPFNQSFIHSFSQSFTHTVSF